MRIALISNPFASSVTRRAKIVIQKALSADHELTVSETARPGQAIRLAHGAARSGAEVVIALGGDGTINEVANGVLGESCAIAPLPGGSTNVFARSIGYPNDAIEATGTLLEALAAGSIESVSAGLANGRVFLFHAGAGFDAAVVAKVEGRGPLKRYLGHPLFIASAFATWFRDVDRRQAWFSVETTDGRRISDAQVAIALNSSPYTYLGNKRLDFAPEASLHGPLSVVALRSLAPRLVPVLLRASARPGGVRNQGATRHWADVEGLKISGPREFPYQLDGEAMGATSELIVEHRADALRLVVPTEGHG